MAQAVKQKQRKTPNRTNGRSAVAESGRPTVVGNGRSAVDGAGKIRDASSEMAIAMLLAADPSTGEHSDDVALLTDAICRQMTLDPETRENILVAARLHDVGKVAIPHAVLRKAGPLDTDEWELIKEHTIIGERIMRSVPELCPAAILVRHSHEHFDGKGYPDGLSGEEIPLGSRIILCADAFHAIRSDRPYRRGRSTSRTLGVISGSAGKQFDPQVVEALEATIGEARGRRRPKLSPRLAVLLATLAIGSGGAFAAEQGWIPSPIPGLGPDSSLERDAGESGLEFSPTSGAVLESSDSAPVSAEKGTNDSKASNGASAPKSVRNGGDGVGGWLLGSALSSRPGSNQGNGVGASVAGETGASAGHEQSGGDGSTGNADQAPHGGSVSGAQGGSSSGNASSAGAGASTGGGGSAGASGGGSAGGGDSAGAGAAGGGSTGGGGSTSGSAPGNSGNAPGQTGAAPGLVGSPPGQSGSAPGLGGSVPGIGGGASSAGGGGSSAGGSPPITPPGLSGSAPGNSGNAPGHGGPGGNPHG